MCEILCYFPGERERSLKMAEDENDVTSKEKVKPLLMYEYLHRLGDKQKEVMEKFYKAALDPCAGTSTGVKSVRCEDELSYFGCSFLSPSDDSSHQYTTDRGGQDPFNPNMVGPKCCEYCKADTTLECDPDKCDRPKLYFLKKRPPFDTTDEEWTSDGYALRDLRYLNGVKNATFQNSADTRTSGNVPERSDRGSFSRFFTTDA